MAQLVFRDVRFATSQSPTVMQRDPSTSLRSNRDDDHARTTSEILKKIRALEIKTRALVETAGGGRARRRRGVRRAALGALPAIEGGTRGRAALRGQYNGGAV